MLLATIEASLNRNIAASSSARALCARLTNKSLSLQLTGLPVFVLHSHGDSIQLSAGQVSAGQHAPAQPADATLAGSALGLLALARKQSTSTAGSGVQISGDAEVAQGFSELLKQAKPDLEEELSRLVGDVAAHQLGTTARHLLDFGKRVGRTLLQNTGEYLTEEGRDVPNQFEADEFVRDVDVLRDDVERFAARLTLLEQKKSSS